MAKRPNERYCYCPERHAPIDRKVMWSFKKHAIETILTNEDGLLLPNNFGTIFIQALQDKVIDSKYKRDNNVSIKYQNDHTDGLRFKIHHARYHRGLRKVRHSFGNAKMYLTKWYRDFKQQVFHHIMEDNWRHYRVIAKKKKI